MLNLTLVSAVESTRCGRPVRGAVCVHEARGGSRVHTQHHGAALTAFLRGPLPHDHALRDTGSLRGTVCIV